MNKEIVNINSLSSVPKYKQIVESIESAISGGILSAGDKIPSIGMLCKTFSLSQDTVLTAYNELKAKGIISSAIGKGYYINKVTIVNQHHVFLLFDTLTAYKEVLYESLKAAFGPKAIIDIYFHHSNKKVFQNLIEQAIGNYTAYVIMPIEEKFIGKFFELLPPRQTFILDQGRTLFGQKYPSVCQNFENDIQNALLHELEVIGKYKKLVLVCPDTKMHYQEIISGFKNFCQEASMEGIVYEKLDLKNVQKGDLYILIYDNDLVALVKHAQKNNLTFGSDIGIISYNESPLKEVVAGGITTISTDFEKMGKTMAEMVVKKQRNHIENPFIMIKRSSL